MTRIRPAAHVSIHRSARRFLWLIASAAGVIVSLGLCASLVSARPVRIAVAPFLGPVTSAAAVDAADAAVDPAAVGGEGDAAAAAAQAQLAERAAEALMTALRERPIDRLVAPDAFRFGAVESFEPSAQAIRQWAYNTAVEAVVVGRVVRAGALPSEGTSIDGVESQRIEIVVRSGHSGAELGRHDALVPNPQDLAAAGRHLAAAILENLGYEESAARAADAVYTVGFTSPMPPSAGNSAGPPAEASAGRGLDATLDPGGFDRNAPIEIKADEAEIVNRGTGRNLVFQRNVLVRQANVTLRSDRLEASYKKGESEPERLDARGRVFVDQGGRRARCDRAIYLRAAQQLRCVGHAELIQGCDIVRGESIEFMLDQDRARVEGAASIVIRPESEAGANCSPQRGVL